MTERYADLITNPDLVTGDHFGQICGWLYQDDKFGNLVRHLGFLLTPQPSP